MMKNIGKITGILLFQILVVLFVIINLKYFTYDTETFFADGELYPGQSIKYENNKFILVMHIVLGILMLVLGNLQFYPSLRKKYKKLHKIAGYIFLGSLVLTFVPSAYTALLAHGGPTAVVAGSIKNVLWLACGVIAYIHIANRRIHEHSFWMLRCYALTFELVLQRVWFLLLTPFNMSVAETFQVVVWLSFLSVVIPVEIYIHNQYKKVYGIKSGTTTKLLDTSPVMN